MIADLLAPATAGALLGGWAAGTPAGTAALTLLESLIETLDEPPGRVSRVRVVLGSTLVGLGIRQWPTRHVEKPPPAWMETLGAATPPRRQGRGSVASRSA